MQPQQKSLVQLFVPIWLETLFQMLAGMVDTLMLSSLNDRAVGAVGTANTYVSIFIMLFSIISTGTVAVMTVYIGAEQPGVVRQARRLGTGFNLFLGVLLSLLLGLGAQPILRLFGVAPLLMEYAYTYLSIIGGGCFCIALIPLYAGVLRAYGRPKLPMGAAVLANLLNVALNAFFLFVVKWGVAGVALATVISRLVNVAVLLVAAGKVLPKTDSNAPTLPTGQILGQILRIGVPSALETMLYNIAMTFVVRFMNQMDADGLNVTARAFTIQIANFSYSAGAALAQANGILVGWRIGAGKLQECSRATNRTAVLGIGISTVVASTLAIAAHWYLPLLLQDPQLIALVEKLMYIDIALEIGRTGNLVFGQALKTSGDAVFTTLLAACFMFLCAVGGTWLFGLRLGLGAVGAYIGMAGDECVRAVGMLLRWQSGAWRSKIRVQQAEK